MLTMAARTAAEPTRAHCTSPMAADAPMTPRDACAAVFAALTAAALTHCLTLVCMIDPL